MTKLSLHNLKVIYHQFTAKKYLNNKILYQQNINKHQKDASKKKNAILNSDYVNTLRKILAIL